MHLREQLLPEFIFSSFIFRQFRLEGIRFAIYLSELLVDLVELPRQALKQRLQAAFREVVPFVRIH